MAICRTLAKAYLIAYNAFLVGAWMYFAHRVCDHHFRQRKPVADLWSDISLYMYIAQTLAIMEIVHAAIGLVRSSLFTTILQVFSRIAILWGIVTLAPRTVTQHWSFVMMSLAWSAVEVPRYMFYAINQIANVPYWLQWLRYSLFYVLYPIGITGELWCIWSALPVLRQERPLTITMPNDWNFAFDYYYCVIVCTIFYVPGAPILYKHMIALRQKKLFGGGSSSKHKKAAGGTTSTGLRRSSRKKSSSSSKKTE